MLLIMMVVQNSCTVLVGRYTRSSAPKEEQYDVNHLITICEVTKFFLACFLEFYTTRGQLLESLQVHVYKNYLDALKISIPALLYLLQNSLLYVALSNLTAPMFQVTYQGKLVTTALVSVFMLNRSYTVQQWICLVVLSTGVAIVVLGSKKDDGGSSSQQAGEQDMVLGLVAVTISCLSSALAGVYFEKVLKKKGGDKGQESPPSLWMRNIQMAFFSVIIAICQNHYNTMYPSEEAIKASSAGGGDKPYLHGFNAWAWVLVGLQAGGGLLVAAVIKYADNVLKGLATGVSVVVATAASTFLFQTPLHGQFVVGATMILASVYVFSNPIQGFGTGIMGASKESEMKPVLPK